MSIRINLVLPHEINILEHKRIHSSTVSRKQRLIRSLFFGWHIAPLKLSPKTYDGSSRGVCLLFDKIDICTHIGQPVAMVSMDAITTQFHASYTNAALRPTMNLPNRFIASWGESIQHAMPLGSGMCAPIGLWRVNGVSRHLGLPEQRNRLNKPFYLLLLSCFCMYFSQSAITYIYVDMRIWIEFKWRKWISVQN